MCHQQLLRQSTNSRVAVDFLESLPPEYAQIFAFDNFTRTQNHVIAKALEMEEGDDCVPVVAAVGSLKNIHPDRIILKNIIVTRYPQRVSKLKTSVRYIFHNPEDVRWFKPVEVWTKCGHRGIMKFVFNGVLQQHDTVCLSIYKRAYPKWPEHRFPLDA
ncbi:hypothetical protein SLA2020_061060 [Shorea laevis]